ncbi:DNA recombination protein RmuC [Acidisarcina polymorpha]|uniref:DNA recombination protein RmuC n=1 Tax=Acidisarcina polymorpha TaxID=2211140 RepID=A0A2Z5FSX2_9BACT|nr:DNA recombination protein RmuC [Acidisarcina polymorpha]AXC09564.1 DNA recombination protein RmuC [Acidisarcina polymorpha]
MLVSLPVLLLGFLLSIVAGYVLGWLSQRGRIASQQASLALLAEDGKLLQEKFRESQIEIAKLEERLIAEKGSLAHAQEALHASFKGLASDVLSHTSRDFLLLAKEQLGAQQVEAKGKLEEKETAIANLLEPVRKTLEALAKETQDLEVKREGAYAAVKTLVEGIQSSHSDLRKETGNLVQALRAPNTRGNWGEQQLKNCIEFAGMVEHCTFEQQVHLAGEGEADRSVRPDVVINLPNKRCIVIDAKTPWVAFLESLAAPDADSRREKLRQHAAQVKRHIEDLQKKRYFERFSGSADFIVCFLPSEALFSAALEGDPGLIEYGTRANVVLSTPTTLIALLRAVAIGWQQSEITDNAVRIQEAGLNLYKKLSKTHEYLVEVGNGIRKAGKAFDSLVNVVEGRGGVFAQARKLRELGIEAQTAELESIGSLALDTRPLRAEDWDVTPSESSRLLRP